MHQKTLHIFSILSLFISFAFFIFYGYLHTQSEQEQNFPEGDAHIAFVLDVSKSMQVRDMWWDSRLSSAKQKILEIINKYPGAEFSLSIFAWESQRVLPFTQDVELFATFLSALDSDNLTKQGTEISEALEDALASFWEEKTGKLILLSDGAEDTVLIKPELQEALWDQELDINIIGVGTQDGGYIVEGTDPFWSPVYKRYQWKRVIAILNDLWLKLLASDLWGTYYDISEDLEIEFQGQWPNWNKREYMLYLILSLIFWILFIGLSIFPRYKNI